MAVEKATPTQPVEQTQGVITDVLGTLKDTDNLSDTQGNCNYFSDKLRAEIKELANTAKEVPATIPTAGSKKTMFRTRTANECLLDASLQPIPRQLFQTLIFEGEITLIFADTNVGKTIFAVQIGNEIAAKFEEKVLYIDLELSDKQFESRYSDNYTNHYRFSNNFYRVDFQRRFSLPEGVRYEEFFIQSLKDLIEDTGAKIVFIDNMTKLVSGDTDQAKTAKPLMDRLTDLKFDYNLTLILLEHTRKTDDGRPISLNDLQGSKMKANFADAAFSIGRSAKDKNFRYVKQMKVRSTENFYDSDNVAVYEIVKENSFVHFSFVKFDSEYNHLKRLDENAKEDRKAKAIEMKAQGISNVAIAKELGVSEGTIRYWLKS